MLRVLGGKGLAVGQFKVGKVEAGGNGAAAEGVGIGRFYTAAKPAAGLNGDHGLCSGFLAQQVAGQPAIGCYLVYGQGSTVVVVPQLVAGYAVQGRELAILQQEVDRRHSTALPVVCCSKHLLRQDECRAVYLGKGAAFNMRLQVQPVYPVLCSMVHWQQI